MNLKGIRLFLVKEQSLQKTIVIRFVSVVSDKRFYYDIEGSDSVI